MAKSTTNLSADLAAAKARIDEFGDDVDGISLKHDKQTARIQLDQAINTVRKLEKLIS